MQLGGERLFTHASSRRRRDADLLRNLDHVFAHLRVVRDHFLAETLYDGAAPLLLGQLPELDFIVAALKSFFNEFLVGVADGLRGQNHRRAEGRTAGEPA